ncbi:Translation initiation factor eIF-2B subunit gamma [Phytophthora cinnamomi]|uniref:Translation initiation factor eIF-2B subunit gamma n=1 Tax=Phytophthora cinnamomi TaxID=4785 RepID=UPI00355A6090|nr:Translation initiation factor eIF-2B subunit gamma [Phytophthora cinnamomi]
MAEFQAVILAGGRGIRLYPLTEETPKSLLTANGRPLLWYQLHLLETSGFTEVLVLTVPDLLPPIQDYLTREFDGKLHVELCEVADNTETADALREVADKIKRDFIVLAGDLVTDVVLHNVADFHRIHDASVTMLLRQDAPARKPKADKPRRDKDMTDCIALADGQRVVLVSQAVHMNEDLYVAKSLLKRRSHFVLHTDLYDGHFYIFSHWVLGLLQEKKYIASIKADLVPHLVRRQFRGAAALPESVRAKAASKQALAASLSLSEEKHDPDDLVRCFAYVLPPNAYCERADTIPAYKAMDEEVGSRLRIKRSGSISN